MKSDIRCSTCPHMVIPIRNKISTSNYGMSRPRGCCYCKHPESGAILSMIVPGAAPGPGFITYTKGATDEPDIKTAPRWCPRKRAEEPREISREDAYRIITYGKPQGLFFVQEENGFAGINNATGEAWTENFRSKTKCLEWLTTQEGSMGNGK